MAFHPSELPGDIREVFSELAKALTNVSPHAIYNEARAHLRQELIDAGWIIPAGRPTDDEDGEDNLPMTSVAAALTGSVLPVGGEDLNAAPPPQTPYPGTLDQAQNQPGTPPPPGDTGEDPAAEKPKD